MHSAYVIVCTHNPRMDYLERTLAGLRAQTLPRAQWRLLVVDNLSDDPLAGRIDLSWHPRGRVVREENPGLTAARLRGIRESEGDLIIFVDDDNVLDPDYLAAALDLFTTRADLGVASGAMLPEYESPPPAWFTGECESWLAVRRLKESAWSSFVDSRSEPAGAGMCIRRSIARVYFQAASGSRIQQLLDRRGQSLLSGGDVALAKTALTEGYGMGQFVELKLLHLIPSRRLQPDYLFSLYRHLFASGQLLGWLDAPSEPCGQLNFEGWMKEIYRLTLGGPLKRRLAWERFQGRRLARKLAASVPASGT